MQESIEQIYLRELFALRYQVYCVERSFLSPDEYPNGEESDSFDATAVHFAALDRAGKVLGSVRLVQHTPEFGFPYEEHCLNLFPGAKELPVEGAVEISRLVVSKNNLRRVEDRDSDFIDATRAGNSTFLRAERRSSSSCEAIVLGLYKAMYQYCLDAGITHWYAAMERSLVRLLARYGVSFSPIGPITDYFGPVIPHCVSLTSLQSSVGRFSEQLLDWFNDPEPNSGSGIRVIQLTSHSNGGAETNRPIYSS